MNAIVIDMQTLRRIDRESSEQRWVRDRIERELNRCRLSPARIGQAVAEGKRKLAMRWPKENAAAAAIEWALGPGDQPIFGRRA